MPCSKLNCPSLQPPEVFDLLICSYLKPLVHPVPCSALAQRWNMPRELAYDLAALALYDIVIYCDDSGSMIFEENGESRARSAASCEFGLNRGAAQALLLLQSQRVGQEHAWAACCCMHVACALSLAAFQ